MAKRKATGGRKQSVSTIQRIRTFFQSSVTQYILGVIILAFALFASLSMVSFLFTGSLDQSKVEHSVKIGIANWMGFRGAVLGNILVNEWFGIASIFLLIFTACAGLRLMKAKYINLVRSFILCSLLTIWTSTALYFFFGRFFSNTVIYIGGKHGLFLSHWLTDNFGNIGSFLILLILFVIIMTLITRQTIGFLRRLQEKGTVGISKSKKLIFPWKKRAAKSQTPAQSETPDFIPIETKPNRLVEDKTIEHKPFVREETAAKPLDFEVTKPQEEEYIALVTPKKPVNHPQPNIEEDANELVEELGLYDPTLDLAHYQFPTIDLLKKYNVQDNQIDMAEQNENKDRIIKTLEHYNIQIKSIKATVGPTITLYEIVPDDGVRISKIRNLEDDIAMNLKALGIRIIAPMPGKGTVGIEVPNKDPQIVSMHSIIASKKYQESTYELPIAIGKTITNEVFMVDLTKMPHLLVAGATGQGKSVGLNAAITSLLYKKHPAELKFVLVDPKMVEFNIYSTIEKHFLAKLPDEGNPIITDFTKVTHTLNSLTKEMDDRYKLLNLANVRNVKEYNDKFINRRLNPMKGHRFMPYIVVIIDEFGDLIMTAGKEIELPIARIAQKARAVGIHMIIATQRPTTNIITGTIKANFPARMAFRVMAMIDSRTILDQPGANQLIGRGDLLFTQGNEPIRVQCAFVDTPEVDGISRFIGDQQGYPTAFELPEYVGDDSGEKLSGTSDLSDLDPLFDEASRLIVIHQSGSTSLIQRKFSIGYNRAGRLMDQLELAGVVGPTQGSKAREVLIPDEYHLEQLLNTIKK
ncbi:MAG: DNA translocase FtsK [Dysgonamonadaceae bacterium]|jgi:S-DNA-T family DNA segregation ATPase FtsK/SpoIIIE|nr:DNA translocase FtsK [Dysgonamonadaceae bacterium]